MPALPPLARACARPGGGGRVSAQRGLVRPARGGAGAGPTRPLGGRGRARAGEALAASSAPRAVCAEWQQGSGAGRAQEGSSSG